MFFKLLVILLTLTLTHGKIHDLQTLNDTRKHIAVSTFGFYKGGLLNVQLQNFIARPIKKDDVFGFSLHHTLDNVMTLNFDAFRGDCALQQEILTASNPTLAYFILDLNYEFLQVKCNSQGHQGLDVYENLGNIPVTNGVSAACEIVALNFVSFIRANQTYYNTSFTVYVESDLQEGLYSLYFHSCPNYARDRQVTYDFLMVITEKNVGDNFLSAGEMPLPIFYCSMDAIFFLSGCFWTCLLKQSRHPVLKIHYFMAVSVFLKAVTSVLQGVNYHLIEITGLRLASWVISFYIVHLFKNLVFLVTLILIGIGWTFVKSVLDLRDKLLLIIVILLQVFANVIEIIQKESAREYMVWLRNVSILLDILCCICILLPGIWSIHHVRKASQTYGKAAVNLTKLFRFFYVMVVCYIYFTRVMSYLLRITVPFQYSWIEDMFREMVIYIFFVLLGYKFRPAALNPYFSLPSDEM